MYIYAYGFMHLETHLPGFDKNMAVTSATEMLHLLISHDFTSQPLQPASSVAILHAAGWKTLPRTTQWQWQLSDDSEIPLVAADQVPHSHSVQVICCPSTWRWIEISRDLEQTYFCMVGVIL